MLSVRNRDQYLDAAREVILAVGWRRATLTDVARKAGVSRMTIYRAFPDMQSILADLMTREWVGHIDPSGEATPAGIAQRFSSAVAVLRQNDLFRQIVDIDPEQLLPYLIDRRGRTQDAILAGLTDQIAEGQAAGQVRPGSPPLLARSLILTAHGFAISAHTMVDDALSDTDFDAELAILVERFLAA